jgi:hypothetical protein
LNKICGCDKEEEDPITLNVGKTNKRCKNKQEKKSCCMGLVDVRAISGGENPDIFG